MISKIFSAVNKDFDNLLKSSPNDINCPKSIKQYITKEAKLPILMFSPFSIYTPVRIIIRIDPMKNIPLIKSR